MATLSPSSRLTNGDAMRLYQLIAAHPKGTMAREFSGAVATADAMALVVHMATPAEPREEKHPSLVKMLRALRPGESYALKSNGLLDRNPTYLITVRRVR